MCDKRHANKHQAKEDQTHMPLPPQGTSHVISLSLSFSLQLMAHIYIYIYIYIYIPDKVM